MNDEGKKEIARKQIALMVEQENGAKKGARDVTKSSEEASASCSPTSKRLLLGLREKENRNKGKRKKSRGTNDGADGSSIRAVQRKLLESVSL